MEGSIIPGCSIRGAGGFSLQWNRTIQTEGRVEKEIVVFSTPEAYKSMLSERFTGQIAEQLFEEMLRAYKASGQA